jgi:hypothetical protein
MEQKEYRAVRIERGPQGWGGPLVIQPTAEKDKIVAVTGGGIPEVARKIAELTGAEAVDGFRAPPPESEIAAVIVDCGGPARAGVYPRKRIPTINLTPVGQAGPAVDAVVQQLLENGIEKDDIRRVWTGLLGSSALGLAFLVLKVVEYSGVSYRWDSHAYGSIVWTIIGFHGSHVAALLLKTLVVATLAIRGYFNRERRLGVTINGIYWHFVVAIWIPLYVVLYLVPRM